MIVYWIMLGFLSLGALLYQRRYLASAGDGVEADTRLHRDPGLLAALTAITLLVGLRYRVGGDWSAYAFWFREIPKWPLELAVRRSPDEIGYTILNWLAGRAGWPIWVVNLFCAVPFMAGLFALSRQQPNPWLAWAVATPLLIVVVGMGYTRQATAMGFMLIGLTGISRGRGYGWFFAWTLVGSLFHQSVLVFIPLVPLLIFRFTILSVPLIALALLIGYLSFEPHLLERYSIGYVRQLYIAKGALFRIVPNAVAGALLLLFPSRFEGTTVELRVWRGIALVSLGIQVAYFFVASTVSLDRVSVYVLPLQVWVWSKLPTAFGIRREPDIVLTMLVIAYSSAVLILWLTFANHSQYWVPYRFYPIFGPS